MLPTKLTLSGIVAACISAAFAAILLALIVQTVRIEGFKLWPLSMKGLKVELAEAKEELDELADESAARQRETARTVDKAKSDIGTADTRARQIEQAPLPGGCKTPDAIKELGL